MDLIKLFLGCFIGCLMFVLNIKFLDYLLDKSLYEGGIWAFVYHVFVVCEMAVCVFILIIALNGTFLYGN